MDNGFMKYCLFLSCLILFSCASNKKIESFKSPNKAISILNEDKDTLLIEPIIKNLNNDKLIFYFHGSGGPTKYSLDEAFLFANYGFKVVHFCWYNCSKKYSDDLDSFEQIDLKIISEKIKKVLTSLSAENNEIILIGISRGAEAVSMIISHPELSPFKITKAVVIAGVSVTADSRKSIPRKTLNYRLANPISRDSNDYTSKKSSWSIAGIDIANRKEIDIYNFSKPIMIIHGKNDNLWSVENAFRLQKNYEKNGLKAVVELIPNGGHAFPKVESKAFESMINFLSLLH
jgi:predicted esterase